MLTVTSSNRLLQKNSCVCYTLVKPVCCNGEDYSNSCFAKCDGCTDEQISDGPC